MIKLARYIGVTVQGLVLGVLLFQALLKLFGEISGATVFQYQGF